MKQTKLFSAKKIVMIIVVIAFFTIYTLIWLKVFEKDTLILTNNYSTKYIDSDVSGLVNPQDMAILNDNILVSDSGTHSIEVLNFDGEYIRSIGSLGSAPGEFNKPHAIVVYGNEVYVLDSGNKRIQILDEELNFNREINLTVNALTNSSEFSRMMVDESGIYLASQIIDEKATGKIIYMDYYGNTKLLHNNTFGDFLLYNGKSVFAKTSKHTEKGKFTNGTYKKVLLYSLDAKMKRIWAGIDTKLTYSEMVETKDGIVGLRPNGACIDFYINQRYDDSYPVGLACNEWGEVSKKARRYDMIYANDALYVCCDSGGLIIVSSMPTEAIT